ncbi:MAG: hypothetical protein M3R70_13205 [Actinomycetota bacterium]|nr:hypothetical protein [Actinomycetota bacterium]
MSTEEKRAPDDVRAKADEIKQRLQSDDSFRQQLESNPEEALTGAGLPKEAVEDFLRESGSGEVAGYRGCTSTCGFTCLWTGG